MSNKRARRVRQCEQARAKKKKKDRKRNRETSRPDFIVDGGGVRRSGQKHPALNHPAICASYTGNAEWEGETWVFIDGKPIEPLQARYDRAREAGY